MKITRAHLSLPQSKISELRDILSSRQLASEMVLGFAVRLSEEAKTEASRELVSTVFGTQATRGIDLIFDHCESPIERIFFASFLLSCLRNGFIVAVLPPPKQDFTDFCKEMQSHTVGLFHCYSFYRDLPDDARPKTFLRFLEITGVEPGQLPQHEAQLLSDQAISLFELKMLYVVHLVLQPSFENFDGNRSARPDAVLWMPSNPSKLKVVVECDGFEFHGEHSAFTKDRQRDRSFSKLGYSVRRYSGSEIHSNPITAGFDLSSFLVDQGPSEFSSIKSWKKSALKGYSRPAQANIARWRSRMTQEDDSIV